MKNEQFNNRNVSDSYFLVDIQDYPTDNWGRFTRAVKRTFRAELFVGLWVVLREMIKFDIHTIQYPAEKMPIGFRYRAVHEMKRMIE
jgi:NADH-quinone oxidoreductase subunit I